MQRSRKINPYREKKNQPKLTQIDTNDRISKDIKRHNVTALGEFKIETKIFFFKKSSNREFPGCPVVRTPYSHGPESKFNPSLGN